MSAGFHTVRRDLNHDLSAGEMISKTYKLSYAQPERQDEKASTVLCASPRVKALISLTICQQETDHVYVSTA